MGLLGQLFLWLRSWNWTAMLALGASTIACEDASASAPVIRAEDNRGTAVEYGQNGRISIADIDRAVAHQLFEIRSAAATERVVSELLNAEAARRGMTVDELMRTEIDAKIAVPSTEDLRALYESEKQSSRSDSEPLPSFAEFEVQLRTMKERADRRARQEAFFDELIAAAKVRIDFTALGRPDLRISLAGPSRGPADARVTVVEYTDFESPFCAQAHLTVERLIEEFPADVRVVFKQNPQPEHSGAERAAVAALCADDQGRYWEYRKALFGNQKDFAAERLLDHATRLGLDMPRFSECLQTEEKLHVVRHDIREAQENGLEGTPVFSVNGTRLSGAHPIETFRRLIRFELPRR